MHCSRLLRYARNDKVFNLYMMKKSALYIINLGLLCCCIFFAPPVSCAQTRGKVEVIKDPLIDTLIARRPYLNKTILGSDANSSGFRVQIYFGSSRQAAYDAQAKFMNEYPETSTYISYIEPNFKVQVGDFRTRLEAQKLQNELNGMFNTLFIIPTKINPPKSDNPE
jgi:hypothetical protein